MKLLCLTVANASISRLITTALRACEPDRTLTSPDLRSTTRRRFAGEAAVPPIRSERQLSVTVACGIR